MDLILHEDAIFCFSEGVAMMPDLVGSRALIIHKKMPLFYLLNLGDPVHPYQRHQPDLVADDLTFHHCVMRAAEDFEA